jgi:hypothetical protein
MKLVLAGIPLTPIERVSGAIFYAATDVDSSSNGSAWVLPDEGPVFRLEKETLTGGVYDMLAERVRTIQRWVSHLSRS